MGLLTSPKTYAALAVFQAGDAVACAIPLAPIEKLLDDLGVPAGIRPVLPVAKAASAVGLLSRSEEHTSELQSPYVISYAVF
ncbi:hypothetical protein MGAST_13175, partial [Mycobacterium gastri 'Wayne']